MEFILTTVAVTVAVVTLGILLYMSYMSADRNGWHDLASVGYRLRDRPETFQGKKFHFRTAVMNGFAFHGILVIGVSDDGLLLHPFWLLRAFHPTLFFPWEELEASRFQRTHHAGVRVEVRDPQRIQGEEVGDERLATLGLEWSEKTHRLVAEHLPVG